MDLRAYPPKFKKYQKKSIYSYTLGIYPTLDLLKYQSMSCFRVLISEKASQTKGCLEIVELAKQLKIPYEYNDKLINKLAYKENTYAVGLFEKELIKNKVSLDKPIVVLDEVRNMGNLGTIIRTMVGFGLYDLVISGSSADIYDPKVLRSAMGAFFQIRFSYTDSLDVFMSENKDRTNYGLMLEESALRLSQVEPVDINKVNIIMGNEAQGIDRKHLDLIQPIYIQQKGDIDSLNLSIAFGVTAWHFSKFVD